MSRKITKISSDTTTIDWIWQWRWPLLSIAALGFLAATPLLWPGDWGIGESELLTTTIERELRDTQGNSIRDAQGNLKTEIQEITIKEPGKSLWDGLNLLGILGVPVILFILGIRFQTSQQKQADEEAREEVLQVYFDSISALLVDKNLMAIAAKATPESLLNDKLKALEATEERTLEEQALLDTALNVIRNRPATSRKIEQRTPEQEELLDAALDVIRARTLSILRRFEYDIERKSSIIRFLAEAEIISKLGLNLRGANLKEATLLRANLKGANLLGVNLEGAKLQRTKLQQANLLGANLKGANLEGANLEGANLLRANLENANLIDANLTRASLEEANLKGANLRATNFKDSNLQKANLDSAYLEGANFQCANLEEANLEQVNNSHWEALKVLLPESEAIATFGALSGQLFHQHINLRGANLKNANLRWANLKNIGFNDDTTWPHKNVVATAKTIPDELKKQFDLLPDP